MEQVYEDKILLGFDPKVYVMSNENVGNSLLAVKQTCRDGRIGPFVESIRECDLIITHRLHSTIFAFLAGIPAITISKSSHSLGVTSDIYNSSQVFIDQ